MVTVERGLAMGGVEEVTEEAEMVAPAGWVADAMAVGGHMQILRCRQDI